MMMTTTTWIVNNHNKMKNSRLFLKISRTECRLLNLKLALASKSSYRKLMKWILKASLVYRLSIRNIIKAIKVT